MTGNLQPFRPAYDWSMRIRKYEDLARAVDLARKVLADLERDEIPGPLVRIAAQTRPALVPPMQRRLIDEIDRNEWFREQVAARFEGTPDAENHLEKAAALFLLRPEGWEEDLEGMSRRSERAQQSERIEELVRRINELQTELDDWRNRAKRYRKRADETAAQSDRRVAVAREETHQDCDGRIRELERNNRSLCSDLEEARAGKQELRSRLKEAREKLEKIKAKERPVDPVPAPNIWAPLDLLDAARLLDDMVKAFSPAAPPPVAPREGDAAKTGKAPLNLPEGIPPDGRAAVDWLLTLDRDFVLLVDGYNVGYHLDRTGFNTPVIRNRIENDLARLKNLALGRPRVILVYDSDQAGVTTRDSSRPSGIEIRFTTAEHSADDEVLALAAEFGEAVVVSSDRRVREGAQSSGSLGLWSEALAGWIRND